MKSILTFIRFLIVAALFCFGVYVLFLTFDANSLTSSPATSPATTIKRTAKKPAIDPEAVARAFMQEHEQKINECANKDQRAIESAVQSLNSHFEQKEMRVDALVEELFSLKSKGRMAWYYIKGDGALEQYLQEVTQRYLGSPRDIESAMETILASLKLNLVKNHNELMLAVETDLETLPYKLNINHISTEKFIHDFHGAFDENLGGMLGQTVGTQIGVEAISLAIDICIAPILGAGLINALVTNSIISGGAVAAEGTVAATSTALAPYTVGASLVIGTVIAIVIDITCNHFAEANAKEKITASLASWKESTVSFFKDNVNKGICEFHNARVKALHGSLVEQIAGIAQS